MDTLLNEKHQEQTTNFSYEELALYLATYKSTYYFLLKGLDLYTSDRNDCLGSPAVQFENSIIIFRSFLKMSTAQQAGFLVHLICHLMQQHSKRNSGLYSTIMSSLPDFSYEERVRLVNYVDDIALYYVMEEERTNAASAEEEMKFREFLNAGFIADAILKDQTSKTGPATTLEGILQLIIQRISAVDETLKSAISSKQSHFGVGRSNSHTPKNLQKLLLSRRILKKVFAGDKIQAHCLTREDCIKLKLIDREARVTCCKVCLQKGSCCNSIEIANAIGFESNALKGLVKKNDNGKSQVPWNIILRHTIIQYLWHFSDVTWSRAARRGMDSPGEIEHAKPKVWVMVDTSGSIDNEEFAQFQNELDSVRNFSREIEYILWSDGIIKGGRIRNVKRGQPIDPVRSCGGTYFLPVIRKVGHEIRSQDIMIVMTDGIWADNHNTVRELRSIRAKKILLTTDEEVNGFDKVISMK